MAKGTNKGSVSEVTGQEKIRDADGKLIEKRPDIAVDDGFTLTDGGDIPPGWAPQLSYERSKLKSEEVDIRRAKGFIESTTAQVTGVLRQGIAWNRDCYYLENANDGEKSFPQLRLPESTGLYNALSRFDFGATLKIVYKGAVTVEKGEAHTWDVYVKDTAFRLSGQRPGFLRLLSEEAKKHEEALETAREELEVLKRQMQLIAVHQEAKRLKASNTIDAVIVDENEELPFSAS